MLPDAAQPHRFFCDRARRGANLHVKRQQMAGAPTYDEKRIEEAVLALLYFGSFDRPGGPVRIDLWGITEGLLSRD